MGIIAVFGGTFNPIHIGHKEIIDEILKIGDVEKVIVIPTKIPPHKTVDFMADESDRLNMCSLVAEEFAHVEVSDIELKRVGKSYTIDTIIDLKKLYPHSDIAITIGADMVVTFDEWKDYKEIVKLAKIITFSRTTTDYDFYGQGICKLKELGADVIPVDRKISDISSTSVRNMVLQGKDASKYLPEKVYSYITSNNLYGDNK